MGRTAILFPGQGSLTADAAKQARSGWPELVDRAAELAGDDPFTRAGEGTRYAQPAIYAASLAGWRSRRIEPSSVCALAGLTRWVSCRRSSLPALFTGKRGSSSSCCAGG